MDYELKKFKRDKSSIIPVEEVYTDLDIKENDPHDPSWGYRFDTPRRWAQDTSTSKSIGIRDLKLTPSSGDIRCRFVHMLMPCVVTYNVEWDADDGSYVIDDVPVLHTEGHTNYYVSNDITENITPANGFEEIITDILFNKLSGAVWREIRKARKERDFKYESYSTTNAYTRGLFVSSSDGTTSQDVKNLKATPIPSTFVYEFANDTGRFEVKTSQHLRAVEMTNATTFVDLNENYMTTLAFQHYEPYDTVDAAEEEISGCTHAYVQNARPGKSELLMITSDVASLKNIYALFNQTFPKKPSASDPTKMVDDLDKIATIVVDSETYYVPFIHNNSGSLVTIQGAPYSSYFCLNNAVSGRNGEVFSNAVDINNLNLNNVWDRIHLIYHASFAETRNRMIGRNGDHWDSPNKRFIVPGGDQDEFYLRFTTDGRHNILPIGCHFNVDLCFMLNTTKNTATGYQGNHDSFK